MMLIWVFVSLISFGLSAPSSLFTKTACDPYKKVTLTPETPWILPQTLMANSQSCYYSFTVPSGYFATVSVEAVDMNGKGDESVHISDALGESVSPFSYSEFSSVLAWPTNFQINVQSSSVSNMKVAASISLSKNLVGQNNVKTFSTGLNLPSVVLYSDDLKLGQTITINSQTSTMSIYPAMAYWQNQTYLNNIFVYDGGKLLGTLLQAISKNAPINTSSKSLQLYIAAGTPLVPAAVLITDNSNLAHIYQHSVTYVPLSVTDHTQSYLLYGDSTNTGATTIIGAKDGSNPFDVRQLSTITGDAGTFSYIAGGPRDSHAQDIQLNPAKLPMHITGNVNTFYISQGEGVMKYTLS